MKRALFIAARALFLLALLLGIVLAFSLVGLLAGFDKFGSLYLPTRASLQAHADQLATHMLHRLGEPPMPLQITEFDSTLTYSRAGGSTFLPYLASDDLPERVPLRWDSEHGWLSETPDSVRAEYQDYFRNIANHVATDDEWNTVSMFVTLGTNPAVSDSSVTAGQWTFTDHGSAFSGALTPHFYDQYAQRWFSEFMLTGKNAVLDGWMWTPAEFRLAFKDTTYAPVILREGQPFHLPTPRSKPDSVESAENAEERASLFEQINRYFATDPDWRENADWFEATLHPGDVSVQVASPFLLDHVLRERAQQFAWIILGVLALALVVTIARWIVPIRTS